MTEVGFYHLTRTPLEGALPRLLGRVLDQSARAVVLCGGPERLASLDAALWVSPDPDWLPHGTPAGGNAAMQPIWLTTADERPNNASYLFLVDGAESALLGEYARALDLFDGNDPDAVARARERWRRVKDAGHSLTYWKQGPRGWEQGP